MNERSTLDLFWNSDGGELGEREKGRGIFAFFFVFPAFT